MNPPRTLKATRLIGPLLAAALILTLAIFVLRMEHRLWWCECGSLQLLIADAWGSHNSQHFADPYSLTHMLHGFVFWWGLVYLWPSLSIAWRGVLAMGIEAIWEIAENWSWVIERYRSATAAVGYTGDTVANSVGDILFCAVGFVIAWKLGWKWTLTLFVLCELLLLFWIRDSLLLNVLMLTVPIDAVKEWQLGM